MPSSRAEVSELGADPKVHTHAHTHTHTHNTHTHEPTSPGPRLWYNKLLVSSSPKKQHPSPYFSTPRYLSSFLSSDLTLTAETSVSRPKTQPAAKAACW